MKNIDSINRIFLLPNFKLEKCDKWYEFRIIDLKEEDEVYNFEWKKPISSLYDSIQNGNESKIISIINSKKEIENDEEIEELENNIVLFQKTKDAFINDVDNIIPDEKSLDRNPPKIYRGFYFPDFLPNLIKSIITYYRIRKSTNTVYENFLILEIKGDLKTGNPTINWTKLIFRGNIFLKSTAEVFYNSSTDSTIYKFNQSFNPNFFQNELTEIIINNT